MMGGREEADRDVLPSGFLRKAKNHLLLTGMGPKAPPQASGTGRDMCERIARGSSADQEARLGVS